MKRDFLRCLVGGTAGLLLTGASAFAADLPMAPAPAPIPVFTWTGFELGAQVGGGWGQTRFNLPPFSDTYGSAGVFGGLHVGFNYQLMGPIVVGVQGEYNFAGITGHAFAPPLDYLATSIRQFGSADARIGVAFDRVLLYAIGGFAYGDIRNTVGLAGFPINRFFAINRYGYDVGGGIEYNFAGNWTARVEYRYYDFGRRGFNDAGFGFAGNPIAIPNHSSRETLQTARVGLTYKFAWPSSSPVVAKY
jgi:outer membrane immunogenic protein